MMKHLKAKRFLLSIGIAMTAAMLAPAVVQAEEPVAAAKSKVVRNKKSATKKTEQAVARGGCEASARKWGEGEHCMASCNDKATLCDMQICKDGAWKPYSSCFGKGAVSPNCPAAC